MGFRFSFVRSSSNSKTGPIPVTMTDKSSCPDSCQLKGAGCYASNGMVNIHWSRLGKPKEGDKGEAYGLTFEALLESIRGLPEGQLWRHNVAGDLPSFLGGKSTSIDNFTLYQLIDANKNKQGFTYTHHQVLGHKWNQQCVKHANANGFTVNLSADSPEQADELLALGIGPVVCILPADASKGERPEGVSFSGKRILSTPKGKPIVVCPAALDEHEGKGITCERCQLCAKVDRASIVGFPSHGVQKKKAQRFINIASV